MGIWLKDAMKIEPFNRCRLIAGINGVDRMVVAVNIQEVPEVDRWMGGGEILFTSGYAFGEQEEVCHLLERLVERGLTAMVIKPGQYLDVIPDYIIQKANELGLPLFTMPSDLPYMDCILPIMSRITDDHYSAYERTERIHNQLLQAMVGEEGLAGITEILYHVIGAPVLLLSTQGELLNVESGDRIDAIYIEALQEMFRNYIAGHRRKLLQNKSNMIQLEDGIKRVCIPVASQNELMVYMLLDCHIENIHNTDLIAVENAGMIITVTILQERAFLERERSTYSQLLSDIMNRKYTDILTVHHRLNHIGFDYSHEIMVCQIGADDFEDYISDRQMRIDENSIQIIKSRIQSIVTDYIRSGVRTALCMQDGAEMAILFSVRSESDIKDVRIRISEVLTLLESEYEDLGFSAGIGTAVRDINKAEQSWKEAKLAKKVGRMVNRQTTQRVTMVDDLGCLSFLYQMAGSRDLLRFYDSYMEELIRYDEKNGMNLIRTLEVYFENNKNIRRTADELFVHKNSVIYRLKKVESIIGEKLEDSETAFNLQMCLKIREMM